MLIVSEAPLPSGSMPLTLIQPPPALRLVILNLRIAPPSLGWLVLSMTVDAPSVKAVLSLIVASVDGTELLDRVPIAPYIRAIIKS